MKHPEDDELHEDSLPIPIEGAAIAPSLLDKRLPPLAANPFTEEELRQLSNDVPCLFYVDDPRSRGAGVLPRGIVGVLAGASGAGKSFLALEMLFAAANGDHLFGKRPPPNDNFGIPYVRREAAGNVLYLSLEDSREIVGRRLRDIVHERGRTDDLSRIRVVAWDELDCDRALFRYDARSANIQDTVLFARASRTLEDGGPWSLIVVDTFARAAFGDVEKNPEAATAFVQRLEEWTKLPGRPTVLVIHHPRKPEAIDKNPGRWLNEALSAESARGTGAIVGSARWLGMIAKLRADDVPDAPPSLPRRNVFFEVAKVNGVADDAMPRLHMVPGERGVLRVATPEERAQVQRLLKGDKETRTARTTPQKINGHDWSGVT